MSVKKRMDNSVNTIIEISQQTSESMQQTEKFSDQVSQLISLSGRLGCSV